jgi:hypothetical protein
MFNNENINTENKLVGLILKLIETPTGKQIISCQYEGKNYRGFVNEKEVIGNNGGAELISLLIYEFVTGL